MKALSEATITQRQTISNRAQAGRQEKNRKYLVSWTENR